jgi:hypothetical protein
MNASKYIGMDVHLATLSIAVLDAMGKLSMEVTMATQASMLVDSIRGLSGTLYGAFEEGTSAHWLYTLLEPHVAKGVGCDPRQNPRRLGEKKSDRLDARKLAEWLRLDTLKPVYHGNSLGPALRELARSYRPLMSDTARVMNRLKAMYRARGIRCARTRVYSSRFRDQWLAQLHEPGVRGRAERLYKQLDLLLPLRQEARAAMLAESRKHPAQKILRSIPALGGFGRWARAARPHWGEIPVRSAMKPERLQRNNPVTFWLAIRSVSRNDRIFVTDNARGSILF